MKAKIKTKAKALLVLGTSSHAGKSLVAAGLCRVLADQGHSVAPFKAQNMSNNSAVCPAGGEIGRAQAVQAQACRILPHCDMNPVLLKPVNGKGSQVVLLGQAGPTLSARQYYRYWPKALRAAEQAYGRLEAGHDYVVLEGAGSPAEVNLAHRDLANLEAARFSQAAWVLVADIERGGVFASVLGTLAILPKAMKARFRGVIINKFRGDASLLKGGLDWLKAQGIPCLGVLPFLPDLRIAEEDSLGLPSQSSLSRNRKSLKIEVILHKHISNFNDLQPLQGLPGLDLVWRKPGSPAPGQQPDLVVLPGTKNTLEDLWELQRSGEASRLLDLAYSGTWLFGICGGYQMLGCQLSDPQGVEGRARIGEGLGLLPLSTLWSPEKVLKLAPARAKAFGQAFKVQGYEIHQGRTQALAGSRPKVWLKTLDGQALGHSAHGGQVMGCYLHGIFDSPAFSLALLKALAKARGKRLALRAQDLAWPEQDAELSRWAGHLARHLDLKALFA